MVSVLKSSTYFISYYYFTVLSLEKAGNLSAFEHWLNPVVSCRILVKYTDIYLLNGSHMM